MGHFQDELERRRGAMRARYPTIAAVVDACRARGCTVEVTFASEGGNERGEASAFQRAHSVAGEPWSVELHRLFTEAQANHRRHSTRGRRST